MHTFRKTWLLALLALTALPTRSFAWGRKGHEVVAYVAYQNLDIATRKEVDYLITLNPCFAQWTQQVSKLPAAERPVALFMLAATWPDLIKPATYNCQPGFSFVSDGGTNPNGHFSDDVPPAGPEASQNIGYTDTRRHKYWHFINTPFSTDGTPIQPAAAPNTLTEISLLSEALQSDEANPLKSYDVVWLEHLVGDIHQPLHAATRFTAQNPTGDEGGNSVMITQSPQELHGYWDDLPGADNLAAAIKMGQTLNAQKPPTPTALDLDHPESWAENSFTLAKQYAYAAPVSAGDTGSKTSTLNSAYQAKAMLIMKQQLFLAGQRLAALLNQDLS